MCPAQGPEGPERSNDSEPLRPSEERFRQIVESIKDYAIFMLDLQGNIVTWNAGAERITGYTAAEIVGSHFSVFYPAGDVRAGRCERALETALREGRFEDEGERVRKDGSLFWANAVLTALLDEQGQPCGVAKVTRDLTERRRAEDERLRLAQEREASRIKDEFLAVISHELRTPLMAILGWSTLLQTRLTDLESVKALETIRRNAQAQARIIDDILDLSDVVTGKLRVDIKPMDMSDVVREALAIARPLADAKRQSVFEDIAPHVAMRGDATRLQHVTWNILSNAIKFTGLAGVIEVTLAQESAQVVLRVLPLLPEPARFAETGVQACRTNARDVFEAIVCENPFLVQHFPELNFNQAIMKAIFMEVPLSRVDGLASRITPELSRMAAGYASERRAAGRPVPADAEFLAHYGAR